MANKILYLDHAASMKPFDSVLKIFSEDLLNLHGNPHALHAYGTELDDLYRQATSTLAQHISCATNEITWTSCATESNNIAIQAAFEHLKRKHTSVDIYYHPMVHSSVRAPCVALEGVELAFDIENQRINDEFLKKSIEQSLNQKHGILLCLPFGNNETGYMDDYSLISPLLKNNNSIWTHVDAAQSLGKVNLNLSDTAITSMTFSGHKIGAPIGIGALYIKMRPTKFFNPIFKGGRHQENRRSGTISVPLIRSFVHALESNNQKLWQGVADRKKKLEDFLVQSGYFQSLELNSSLPHILGVVISKNHDETLKIMKENFAFTQSAACSSSSHQPSRTLDVLGVSHERQKWYCRLSFNMYFSDHDLETIIDIMKQKVLLS